MKLGFVFQKDSHLKAVQATALRLSQQYANAEIQFYALDSDIEVGQIDAVNITTAELQAIQDCDYLISCLGGYLLNKLIAQFADSDTKIIALFPGIVSHYQLDAFISRFNADQVWLNCPADFKLYADLCQTFGVKNNGILYGASWFMDVPNNLNCSGGIIFFEQTQIINDTKTAQQVELQLIDIIQKNFDKPFIYKLRQNIHNDHLVTIRKHLAQFANVQMVGVLSDEMVANADTFLSISSSAVVEGLLLGKQCFLLDKQYLDVDGLEFFKKSNLFLNAKPNSNWLKSRVFAPVSRVMLETISKRLPKKFNQRSFGVIMCKIVLLMWHYPKLFVLIGKSNRIIAIQKSLEYL